MQILTRELQDIRHEQRLAKRFTTKALGFMTPLGDHASIRPCINVAVHAEQDKGTTRGTVVQQE